MTNDELGLLLSQLVDGELPSDEVNKILPQVLDDVESRQMLKGMLKVRIATRAIRAQARKARQSRTVSFTQGTSWRV